MQISEESESNSRALTLKENDYCVSWLEYVGEKK